MRKQGTYNIGLSIGTRSIGIAVMHQQELQSYKVMVFKDAWSKRKPALILGQLKRILMPPGCMVAIKTPPPTYTSRQLKQLLRALLRLLQKQGIPHDLLTIHDLKAHCFPKEKTNKKALIHCISKKYPQLSSTYERECRNRYAHYSKLFEAIIAAEIMAKQDTT